MRARRVARESYLTLARNSGLRMKVICNQCGKILDLMNSVSFAVEEGGLLKTYYFCSDEHMEAFARKRGLNLKTSEI